jgi:hypothetical protein
VSAAPSRNAGNGGRVSWLVLRDQTCVPLSATQDLLTDTGALIEDLGALIKQAAQLTAEARLLVERSRGGGTPGRGSRIP